MRHLALGMTVVVQHIAAIATAVQAESSLVRALPRGSFGDTIPGCFAQIPWPLLPSYVRETSGFTDLLTGHSGTRADLLR